MQSTAIIAGQDSLMDLLLASERKLGPFNQVQNSDSQRLAILDYIEKYTAMKIEQSKVDVVYGAVKQKSFKRRQFILQEGNLCQHIYLVVKGALRLYSVNERGRESIVSLAVEGEWITDSEGVCLNEPSFYNIDALEDAEVLQFDKTELEHLSNEVDVIAKLVSI